MIRHIFRGFEQLSSFNAWRVMELLSDTRNVDFSYCSFFRCVRDPNRVPRIRENYHRVLKISKSRVPTGPYQVPNIFLNTLRTGL